MELIDLETDKLLQDFVKWNEDQDKDLIQILETMQAEQDAVLSPIFEQLETESMKLSELLIASSASMNKA
ncbi:hypothetical protein DU86_08575 [Methanosarcina mazei]|uniref:Uncharacterized protein n=2 Tax=Methanosarcina mazei TaxID=2209 RepID=A0A0F8Q1C0_METMZ|nr:hypothetical protein [Methanosarcina mazei]KKF98481.1 hypothetical protein DU31_07955 [Methanosarcina mazei]KKH39386.1 hypothetical protein DU50_06780 [Methanosarcina mazei]KKH51301.1 hypothetical protein DU85_08975 [Methanosarcina mazei]KKH53119.1 hypothetical protein DU76_10700 [Methanosarcina mazei]KKH68872.1 hypothetical protein DU75_08645 [Methanosarcina mazei]